MISATRAVRRFRPVSAILLTWVAAATLGGCPEGGTPAESADLQNDQTSSAPGETPDSVNSTDSPGAVEPGASEPPSGDPGLPPPLQSIVGRFAGVLIGPESRADGTEFDSEWMVAVEFDDTGTLRGVSELFESGEVWALPADGEAVRRDVAGEDFATTRQLTLLGVSKQSDATEIAYSYQRWNRILLDGVVTYPESRGTVILRLSPAGDDLQCDVQRTWDDAVGDCDHSWIASAVLIRDAAPPPRLFGAYAVMPVDAEPDALATEKRVRFNAAGRLTSFDVESACLLALDLNCHAHETPGSWTISATRRQISDVRYYPDGVRFVVAEFVRIPAYPQHYSETATTTEWRLWPDGEQRVRCTRGQRVETLRWLGAGWQRRLTGSADERRFPRIVESDQIEGTWRGNVSGPRITVNPDGSTTTDTFVTSIQLAFDSHGRISSPNPCGYSFTQGGAGGGQSIYVDTPVYGSQLVERSEGSSSWSWNGGSPIYNNSTSLTRITWVGEARPATLQCEITGSSSRRAMMYNGESITTREWSQSGDLQP